MFIQKVQTWVVSSGVPFIIQAPSIKSNLLFRRWLGTEPTDRQKAMMARSLPKKSPIPGVEHIVVVASGKGGVGKSTIAVNLAVSLASDGKRVGLLDADIFGPSIPLLMNLHEQPLLDKDNLMVPPINFGVKCLSMGLLKQKGPIIWRGPLLMSALQTLLRKAVWGPLDILIVDTPPGTGDVHLSLVQNVPVSGVLLISTPQVAALSVVTRGAEMYKTVDVPIFGLAENMGFAECPNCSHQINFFKSETENYAKNLGIKVLAHIPMMEVLSNCGDSGTPMVVAHPDSPFAGTCRTLAQGILDDCKKQAKVVAG